MAVVVIALSSMYSQKASNGPDHRHVSGRRLALAVAGAGQEEDGEPGCGSCLLSMRAPAAARGRRR